MKKWTLSFAMFCFLLLAWGQERWALVIGNNEYPHFKGNLSSIRYAGNDARSLAALLQSSYCGFDKNRVFLLDDREATSANVRKILVEKISRAGQQDFLFVFFSGHGIPHRDQFYLLFHDTHPDLLEHTAISLRKLADIIDFCVPARKLFIVLDAHRSSQCVTSPFYPDITWNSSMGDREVCLLKASSPSQISKERGGYGTFTLFLLKSLRGVPYLNRTADINGDGFITVSELSDYLCWDLRMAGIQHPVAWGNSHAIVSILAPSEPWVWIKSPRHVQSEIPVQVNLEGHVRILGNVGAIRVSGFPMQFVRFSTLVSNHQVYSFSGPVLLSPDRERLLVEIQDTSGKIESVRVSIPWCKKGWHGEWMPPELEKSRDRGIYVWKEDRTEMVYVPKETAIIGIPPSKRQELFNEILHLREYLSAQKAWHTQDMQLREIVAKGIEESNASIRKIAQKIKTIYDKVQLLEKVQKQVSLSGKPHEETVSKLEEKPPEIDPIQVERKFFQLAQHLLKNCQEDVHALKVKSYEISAMLDYLDLLIQHWQRVQDQWNGKFLTVSSFYMDRCEVTNLAYRRFCEKSSRPLPPSPWWDEVYLFRDEFPVVNVSWEDAMAYAVWARKTLPAEIQWERAARGKQGFDFPWGDREPDLTFVNADVPPSLEESDGKNFQLPQFLPMAVHSFGKSGSGCFHLAGNVQEWCIDISDMANMQIPGKELRVVKGGAFSTPALMLCSWFKNLFPADVRRSDLGFRCVVDALE